MTEFDSVIDLALIDVNDYRLRKLYDKDIDGFKQYCDGFLIRAVQDFKDCRQSLAYDIETRTFESDLTQTEQRN